MPIVITAPLDGGHFGPGILVHASSGTVPANPGTAQWAIAITGETGTPWTQLVPWQQNVTLNEYYLTRRRSTSLTQNVTIPYPRDGAPMSLVVELLDGGVVIETQSRPIVWTTTEGLGMQQFQQDQVTVATGAFTEADRQLLVDTQAATVVDFTQADLPIDMSAVPLSRLPWIAPIGGAQRVGPVVISGRGSLTLASLDANAIWLGMRWFFTVLPGGYGFTRGAIDEFERRIVQLVPVYTLGTTEEVGNPILDESSSGGFYLFPIQPGLARIEYQVAPGVDVTLFLYRVVGT